jgi:hypothetical protein
MTPSLPSDSSAADSIHIENRGRELLTFVASGFVSADWSRELEKSDPRAIIVAIGALNRNDQVHYREAARSMVEYKLTERMVATMKNFDRASGRLGWFGIGVAIIIGIVGPCIQWWLARPA